MPPVGGVSSLYDYPIGDGGESKLFLSICGTKRIHAP